MTNHPAQTVLRLRSKPDPSNLGIQWGWLKDKWGLSWQIVPRALPVLLASQEPGVSQRVVGAMIQVSKFDIAALQRAAAGQSATTAVHHPPQSIHANESANQRYIVGCVLSVLLATRLIGPGLSENLS